MSNENTRRPPSCSSSSLRTLPFGTLARAVRRAVAMSILAESDKALAESAKAVVDSAMAEEADLLPDAESWGGAARLQATSVPISNSGPRVRLEDVIMHSR